MMMQEAIPPIRSPMPGTNPTMPSSPNRIEVPGNLDKVIQQIRQQIQILVVERLYPPRFIRGDSTSGFAVNAITLQTPPVGLPNQAPVL